MDTSSTPLISRHFIYLLMNILTTFLTSQGIFIQPFFYELIVGFIDLINHGPCSSMHIAKSWDNI